MDSKLNKNLKTTYHKKKDELISITSFSDKTSNLIHSVHFTDMSRHIR